MADHRSVLQGGRWPTTGRCYILGVIIMRRELKLIVLALVLIVGPSATLSFLAGRVLGNWQIVLRDRMAREADRVLDTVTTSWVAHLNGLRDQVAGELLPRLVPRLHFVQATQAVADMGVRHPWIREVFVVDGGKGLLYPAGLPDAVEDPAEMDSKGAVSLAALRQADQQVNLSTNVEMNMAVYRRLLDNPDLEPAVNAMVRLRLARGYQVALQSDRAMESLLACVEIAGGAAARRGANPMPLRDPEEGFHLDLVALGDMADLYEATGHQEAGEDTCREMRRRAVERFDILPPLQRQLLVMRLGKCGDDIRWRECLRAYAMSGADHERLERDFGGITKVAGEEGWQWVRFGTNDYLVTPPDPATHAGLLAVLQFERQRLAETVASLARMEGRQAGIKVTCGVQDAGRKPGPDIIILAERRLAAPLDRFVITATPAEPRAFAANAILQKRLYGMGGALLMLGVLVGGWLMWREAAWEIHKAREHSDFAAAVSHDLRTPLSSMRMLAESLFLDRVQDEAKRKKFLSAILKESDRLSRLTDRALYFIRYGEGMLRYRFTEGDVAGVVRETVETFATGIGATVVRGDQREGDGQGWVIQLHVESGLDPVWFDAGAIEQVVFNLLDNAVKYSGHTHEIEVVVRGMGGQQTTDYRQQTTDYRQRTTDCGLRTTDCGLLGGEGRGGDVNGEWLMVNGGGWRQAVRRWFRGSRHRAYVEIAVRDHGAGMSKEEVRRIARPYIRGWKAEEKNARGIGLGLALCRHVIHAHNGRFEIESVVGEGSTFKVILPAGEG
jgi:signal transduction histidine kinase